ncbi:MAG: hypothetical protein AAB728_05965 [Patescibacteria group bacterium]
MKNFHPLSFALGLASGLLVLVIVVGGWRLLRPAPAVNVFRPLDGTFQRGSAGFNVSRMAERLGMTEEELQAELDSGKTFQEIAAGRGIDLSPGGRTMRYRSPASASGTALTGASSSTPSSSGNDVLP